MKFSKKQTQILNSWGNSYNIEALKNNYYGFEITDKFQILFIMKGISQVRENEDILFYGDNERIEIERIMKKINKWVKTPDGVFIMDMLQNAL